MKTSSCGIGVAACLLITAVVLSAAPFAGAAGRQAPASAAEDPAAELFAAMCSRCHDGARITALRRTKAEWEEVLTKMIEKGAMGSEDDFLTVFGYLRRNYGKVYINAATPDEITTSLGLSAKDAEAILAYRKANGPFQDVEAVKKVPDIDVKALESNKDAISF